MPAVVGIDISTRAIDLVRLNENSDEAGWLNVPLAGEPAWARIRQIRAHMPDASWWSDVYLCAIERPFSQWRSDTVRLAQGAVLACIPAELETWEVPPQTWKSALGCNTRKKPDWTSFPKVDGIGEWTQDALDALGVAFYARDRNAAGIEAALGGAA
jgi:hypothetical protein